MNEKRIKQELDRIAAANAWRKAQKKKPTEAEKTTKSVEPPKVKE